MLKGLFVGLYTQLHLDSAPLSLYGRFTCERNNTYEFKAPGAEYGSNRSRRRQGEIRTQQAD
jgi:hypothetical protein